MNTFRQYNKRIEKHNVNAQKAYSKFEMNIPNNDKTSDYDIKTYRHTKFMITVFYSS